ncbi:MAG: hypothetical protein K2X51_10745 [Burkholderiales bacterium]|nr:hypothetical protein [Burkholderiales bacterium]
MNENLVTKFIDQNGDVLGDAPGLLPISFYKGMQIIIHGHPQAFTVVDWSYHHGHSDEDAGLKIILG